MNYSRGRAVRGTLYALPILLIGFLLLQRSTKLPSSGNQSFLRDASVVQEQEHAAVGVVFRPTISSISHPSNDVQNDYAKLITAQKRLCGILCDASFPARTVDMNSIVTVEFLQSSVRRVPISCDHFFAKDVESVLEPRAFEWPPPSTIPSPMIAEYTLDGRVSVKPYYLQSRYSEGEALESQWTSALVQSIISELAARRHPGTYGIDATNYLQDILFEAKLEGKNVLVIGSEKPWLEVACLRAGARKVTTIEYGRIHSEVAELQTLTPSEASAMYNERKIDQFDVVLSYSSLEHAGLGRYGDGLNPWGDVIAVAKAWCMSKSDAKLILGLPRASNMNQDLLFYNAHRVYGPLRWPLVLSNWRAVKVHTQNVDHLIIEAVKVV